LQYEQKVEELKYWNQSLVQLRIWIFWETDSRRFVTAGFPQICSRSRQSRDIPMGCTLSCTYAEL